MVLKRYDDAVGMVTLAAGTWLGVGLNNAGAGLPLKQSAEPAPLPSETLNAYASSRHRAARQCHATGTPVRSGEVDAMTPFGDNCPEFGSTGEFGPRCSRRFRRDGEASPEMIMARSQHPVRGQGQSKGRHEERGVAKFDGLLRRRLSAFSRRHKCPCC